MTVNSGSSANLVAFASLTVDEWGDRAIRPGDEVITTATSFPTTVNPIILYQAIPVFVDMHLATYNVNPEKIESAITEKTKAIVMAHTLGNPFDLDRVRHLADKYNLWLIEDCCDALGATFRNQHVGTFGDIGTLSFYPAHHITMGEGGAVFTNNSKLKKLWSPSVIGVETAGVSLVRTIPAVNVSSGNWEGCRKVMIINTFILDLGTILK